MNPRPVCPVPSRSTFLSAARSAREEQAAQDSMQDYSSPSTPTRTLTRPQASTGTSVSLARRRAVCLSRVDERDCFPSPSFHVDLIERSYRVSELAKGSSMRLWRVRTLVPTSLGCGVSRPPKCISFMISFVKLHNALSSSVFRSVCLWDFSPFLNHFPLICSDDNTSTPAAPSFPLCWWGEVGGPQAIVKHGLGHSFAAGHPQRHPGVCTQREGSVQVWQIRANAPRSCLRRRDTDQTYKGQVCSTAYYWHSEWYIWLHFLTHADITFILASFQQTSSIFANLSLSQFGFVAVCLTLCSNKFVSFKKWI